MFRNRLKAKNLILVSALSLSMAIGGALVPFGNNAYAVTTAPNIKPGGTTAPATPIATDLAYGGRQRSVDEAITKKDGNDLYAITFDTNITSGEEISSILLKVKRQIDYGYALEYIRLDPTRTFVDAEFDGKTTDYGDITYLPQQGQESKEKLELNRSYFYNQYIGSMRAGMGEAPIDDSESIAFANNTFKDYVHKDGNFSHEKLYDRLVASGKKPNSNKDIQLEYGNIDNADLFDSLTTQIIYFRTDCDINENFREMEILLDGGDGCWDVRNVAIYAVDYRYPNTMSSTVSRDVFANFQGTKLWELQNMYKDGLVVNTDDREGAIGGYPTDAQIFKLPTTYYGGESYRKERPYFKNVAPTGYRIKNNSKYSVPYVNPNDDTYHVEVKLSDVSDAGFDRLYRNPNTGKIELKEQLEAKIEYTTTSNTRKTVEVPVITNALLKYAKYYAGKKYNYYERYEEYLEKIKNGEIYSFGQQGDSLFFDVTLPNMKSVDSIEFNYVGNTKKSDNEYIRISDVLVCRKSYVPQNPYDEVSLSYINNTERVLYYWSADSSDGKQIRTTANDSDGLLKLKDGAGRYDAKNFPYLAPTRSTKNLYLARMKTSDVDLAQTDADVKIRFNYVNTKGRDTQTAQYSIREAVNEFYGYWKGTDSSGNLVDAGYNYSMARGNEFAMLFTVNDVSEFTGITLNIDKTDSGKQWQLEKLEIIRLDSIGKRKILDVDGNVPTDSKLTTKTVNGVKIDRIYDRDVTGDVLYTNDKIKLLVQAGETSTFDFVKENTSAEYEERDYSDSYYSMDWEVANTDLAFGSMEKNYTVNVSVPTNEEKNAIEDSCGSKNLFYFQLIFQRGKSAYVLANTQMTSDGFIAGTTASFTISTNSDMGDVVAVNIIPDDMDKNNAILDKLCIKDIEVIKTNKNGINRRFVCENVGWITRDYQTSADNDLISRTEGRTEAELVVSIPIDYSAYILDYEIAITTGQYPDTNTLDGVISANIGYYNSKGELNFERDYDVVKAIYEYRNNKNPERDDATGACIIDTKSMFRPDSTDRFCIHLSDAVQIRSITFCIKAKTHCTWNVKDISVSIITSSGALHINDAGEYQMKYEDPEDPRLLVNSVTNVSMPCAVDVTGTDMINSAEFRFAENVIPLVDDEKGVLNVVSRVPESRDDKVNIYVYLAKGATDPKANGFNVYSTIRYSGARNAYSNMATLNQKTGEDGNIVMYYQGLSVPNFLTLQDMMISASTVRDVTRDYYDIVERAVIQQVRNGVVIDSYTVSFANADIMQGSCNMFSSKSVKTETLYQEVGLTLGANTTSALLSPMNYDLAACINYTSVNDPERSGKVYSSPYIYLTDQEIESIKAGETVKLKFKEGYIKDIVSLRLVATGGLNVSVDSGYINCYSSNSLTTTAQYGLVNGGDVAVAGTEFVVSSKPEYLSKPVSITFNTAEPQTNMVSGTNEPVKLVLTFEKANGGVGHLSLENAQMYLRSGEAFDAGTSATMDLIIPGLKEVRALEIAPTDNWFVDSVTVTVDNGLSQDAKTVKVGEAIYNGNPKLINFSNIVVRVNAKNDKTNKTVDNGTLDILANVGSTVTLKSTVTGSLDGNGYNVRVEAVSGEAVQLIDEKKYDSTSGSFTYTVPDWASDKLCRITVSSAENPNAYSVVNITGTGGSTKVEEKVEPDEMIDLPDTDDNTGLQRAPEMQRPSRSDWWTLW